MALAEKRDLMYCDPDALLEAVDLPADKIMQIVKHFEEQMLPNFQAVVNDETEHIHGVVSRDWQTVQHHEIIEAMESNELVEKRVVLFTPNETTMYALYACNEFLEIPEDDIDLELLVAVRNGHGGKAKISTELWVRNRSYNQDWRLATGRANSLKMNHTNKNIDQFVNSIEDAIEVVQYRFNSHVKPRIQELATTKIPDDMQLVGTEEKESTYKGVVPAKILDHAETILIAEGAKTMWQLFQILCRAVVEVCDPEPQRKHIVALAYEFGL